VIGFYTLVVGKSNIVEQQSTNEYNALLRKPPIIKGHHHDDEEEKIQELDHQHDYGRDGVVVEEEKVIEQPNEVEHSDVDVVAVVDTNNNDNDNQQPTKIAYAVTITGCGKDPITEGAAVLKHSIHLVSTQNPKSNAKYDYQMYAIYHPDGQKCAEPLADLGYTLIERNTPVAVKDIQGDFLRENIEKNGCCGEKELVKLEAYTLIDHPVVVHLDLDVLILKPMDALFDMMISSSDGGGIGAATSTIDAKNGVPMMWPEKESGVKTVNAFFTRDYNMARPHKPNKACQGGFLVLRPDMKVYDEFVEIIRIGDFRQSGGWGGKVGPFYGSMTFQGIIPYYYDILHPNEAVELNRCVYNQMADNPRVGKTVNDIVSGPCRTNQDECEDCRSRPLEDVVSAHFTLCQKPWICLPQNRDIIQQRLCRKLHHRWHEVRSDLEQSWGRPATGTGQYDAEHFLGHCNHNGPSGYMPIQQPFGEPL